MLKSMSLDDQVAGILDRVGKIERKHLSLFLFHASVFIIDLGVLYF